MAKLEGEMQTPGAGTSPPEITLWGAERSHPLSTRRTPLQRHLQAERAWRRDSSRRLLWPQPQLLDLASQSLWKNSRGLLLSYLNSPAFLDGVLPSLASSDPKCPGQPGPKLGPCLAQAAGALTFPLLLLHSKRPPALGRLFLGSSEVTLGPRSADSRERESSALPGTPLETSLQFSFLLPPSISFLSSPRLAGAAGLLGKESLWQLGGKC
ncbi:hypothetical protein LEMLEM_LOCUS17462 [Lemmus lemmus]